jgi:hypothetical protein
MLSAPEAKVRNAGNVTFHHTATVEHGFAGLVVLWQVPAPAGFSGLNPWFKRAIIVASEARIVGFDPPVGSQLIIIDFPEGFDPSPVNLQPLVAKYLASLPGYHPDPGAPPKVT